MLHGKSIRLYTMRMERVGSIEGDGEARGAREARPDVPATTPASPTPAKTARARVPARTAGARRAAGAGDAGDAEDGVAPSKVERLRSAIEDDIVSGALPPATRLDEIGIAERYGVSRTPVREALRELAATGLVELRPRRGAVVAVLDAPAVAERFEVMAEIEAMAGRLAARRIRDDELDALRATHEDCTQAAARGDTDAYYRANERFHRLIYRASGNAFLEEEAGRLHTRLKPYRRLQLRTRHRLRTSLAEHESVLAALEAGDGAAAAEALRGHVGVQGERFGDLLREMGGA